MAYSMMSTTNHKRRCVSSRLEVDTCFESSDDYWINLELDDFIGENNHDNIDNQQDDYSFFSSFKTSSNISDTVFDFLVHENRENLMSKKRKTLEEAIYNVDQELEDTASSPLQSPKVNQLNLFYMMSKERDSTNVFQENGDTPQQGGDSTNTSSIESELRKKGLCLIPTSILLNYLTTNA